MTADKLLRYAMPHCIRIYYAWVNIMKPVWSNLPKKVASATVCPILNPISICRKKQAESGKILNKIQQNQS